MSSQIILLLTISCKLSFAASLDGNQQRMRQFLFDAAKLHDFIDRNLHHCNKRKQIRYILQNVSNMIVFSKEKGFN